MKINVTTTIDFHKEIKTEDDLTEVYDLFREIIKNSYESKDVTDFAFVNADTMMEIEDEVRQ